MGIILLRLEDERPPVKIDILQRLLDNYSDRLADNFVVVNERRDCFVRTAKKPS